MRYKHVATVLLSCVVMFAGCQQREETEKKHEQGNPIDKTSNPIDKMNNSIDETSIKKLVSKAAGMSPETFRKIINAGSADRVRDTIPNKSLTLCLLSEENLRVAGNEDFKMINAPGMPDPTKLANALKGGSSKIKFIGKMMDYASLIRPSYITDLAWEMKDGRISGTVKFSVPDLYSGRTKFIIIKQDSSWTVTEFSMPLRNLTLRLNAEGNWKKIEQ